MFERLSQVVLLIVGAVTLAVLVLGLAVSCREVPGSNELPSSATPGIQPPTPVLSAASPTPLPANPTVTPTPLSLGATATPTPGEAIIAPGGATATPSTLTPGGLTPGTTIRHTVIRGEWLLQIARCYGTAYSNVSAANPLPNPDLIYPGQVITVPNIGSLGRIIGPPCVQAHPVEAGETWESMATRFGTTTAILRRANPGELSLGRIIWAPRP